MRNHRLHIVTITAVLGLFLLPLALIAQDAGAGERGAGQRGAGGARGGRGGRGAAQPSAPTPHWSDGRVNLDAAPGQKGFWNVMQGNIFGRNGSALPTNLTLDEVPFQDWARALYQYRQSRQGLDDPHARCYPAGGMRFFTVPNGLNIIDQPELSRIFLISGENAHWGRLARAPRRNHL